MKSQRNSRIKARTPRISTHHSPYFQDWPHFVIISLINEIFNDTIYIMKGDGIND